VALLTKELAQSNLQVLKDALLCVEGLVGACFVHTLWRDLVSASSSGVSVEVNGLLVGLLQLIRHSNRGVSSTAAEVLRKWFGLDANDSCQSLKLNHGSLLLRLVCTHFQEAIKRKPASIDVLLLWLAELLELTAMRWAEFLRKCTALEIFDPFVREELTVQLVKILSLFVQHKDEKTREAAFVVASHLFALDTLWLQLVSSPPLPSILSLSIPSSISLLLETISPAVGLFLQDLSKQPAWRRHEGKVLQTVDRVLRKLT
jgi:hypothetical protein